VATPALPPQWRDATRVELIGEPGAYRLHYHLADRVNPVVIEPRWLPADFTPDTIVPLVEGWLRKLYGTVAARRPTTGFLADWTVGDPLPY
jgi:hypothetical protein